MEGRKEGETERERFVVHVLCSGHLRYSRGKSK